MAQCPVGHDSTTDDFCDICGMKIAAPSPPGTPSRPGPAPGTLGEPCPRCGSARTGQFCEACGFNFNAAPPRQPAPHVPSAPPASSATYNAPPGPSGPYSSSAPANAPSPVSHQAPSAPYNPPTAPYSPPGPAASHPYPQTAWTAVVSADRAYYEEVRAATGPDGADIAFPPYCAERRFQLSGSQMRIGRRSKARGLEPEIDLTGPPTDPGISRLHAVLLAAPDGSWAVLDPGSANGTLVNGHEIAVGDEVPLHDGDRINVGAWTAITVHRG